MTLTHEQLRHLIELSEKATQGSWNFERVSFDDGNFTYEINEPRRLIQISELNYDELMKAKFDSDWIQAANPETIRAMAEECLELRERLKPIRSKCGHLISQGFGTYCIVCERDRLKSALEIARDALKTIRNDSKLWKAGKGGQDRYSGLPPAMRWIDSSLAAIDKALEGE